jgi:PiT family inorganic phosphate transporter
MSTLLLIAIATGFYTAWGIGANDCANSMADAVGSKALRILPAVILAAIFEFAGAFLVGGHVTDTIRKGIIDASYFTADPHALAVGLTCALLAAAIWLNVASLFGLPVSTTHSTVGAVAGFGILEAGVSHVEWFTLGKIVASWFASPIGGGIIAFIIFKLITHFILAKDKPVAAAIIGVPVCTFFAFAIITLGTVFKGLKNLKLDLSGGDAFLVSGVVGLIAAVIVAIILRRKWKDKADEPLTDQLRNVEKVFAILVIITSCSVAFSHGANDVANSIGPLAAIVDIIETNQVTPRVGVPLWVLALGGGGIVLGLATFGYRVMLTIGTKITEISPSRGVAADMAATITVLGASRLGIPISTTHVLVGAIIGVGLARGISAINLKTIQSVFTSWILTLPIVAVLTMILYTIAGWIM